MTLLRSKRKSCTSVALLEHFYIIGGLTALAALEHQPSKKIDRIVPVTLLQLVIMNNRLIRLVVERQARRRRRVKRFLVYPWLSADQSFQLGHYDQLMREPRVGDSTSVFNYENGPSHV